VKNKPFNWDAYFSSATWDEVRKNSPMLSVQRLPSLTIHEQGVVYLSSLDLDFSISDIDGLKNVLPEVKDAFHRAKKSNNYYKMAVANYDFEEIKNLLASLGVSSFDSIDA
jgi:hypothetical protein